MGKAYIVVAAMQMFGLSNTKESPFDLQEDVANLSKEDKLIYFNSKLGGFVKKNGLQSDHDSTQDDGFQNYGLKTIFLTCLVTA